MSDIVVGTLLERKISAFISHIIKETTINGECIWDASSYPLKTTVRNIKVELFNLDKPPTISFNGLKVNLEDQVAIKLGGAVISQASRLKDMNLYKLLNEAGF